MMRIGSFLIGHLALAKAFVPNAPRGASRGLSMMSIDAAKSAIVCIEFQNDFASPGGGLYDAVKGEMERTNMIENTKKLVDEARAKGVKIIHAPITFADDYSDAPQSTFGILKGVVDGGGFKASEWGGKIIDDLSPKAGDLVVDGKKGLDAFPGSNLKQLLDDNGIENVAFTGFLTNCCVESSTRTAYELGYKTFVIPECCAALSEAEHKAAAEGTLNMFSESCTTDEFLSKVGSAVSA